MIYFFIGVAHADINISMPFNKGETYTTFNDYFSALTNWAVGIAALIAVLVIVYAGYSYTQSQGQADKTSQAKELAAGALTGLALLLMIRLITPTLGIDIKDNTPSASTSTDSGINIAP